MQLTQTTLKIEAESARTTNSGTVIGKIYLASEVDHLYFPELGWSDFIAAILVAALKEVSQLQPRQHACVFFMDGPFELQIERLDESVLRIKAMRRGLKEKALISTVHVLLAEFLEDLIESARRLLQVCDRQGWSGLRDIKQLRALIERIEKPSS